VIEGIIPLERRGLVSRANNFQELLNSIAVDIRNKHQKRMRRQADLRNMSMTLSSLAARKKYLDDQINQYGSYIECELVVSDHA
jgi:Ras GTPase-activating-like protein IQGAP2/3